MAMERHGRAREYEEMPSSAGAEEKKSAMSSLSMGILQKAAHQHRPRNSRCIQLVFSPRRKEENMRRRASHAAAYRKLLMSSWRARASPALLKNIGEGGSAMKKR